MNARSYSRLAALLFAIIAVLERFRLVCGPPNPAILWGFRCHVACKLALSE